MIHNTKLVDYGIQNEQSDIRAHVSMTAQGVYVYRTEDGKQLIQERGHLYRCARVRTRGIITAQGYPVPPKDIPHCKFIPFPDTYYDYIQETDSTSQKGKKAIDIVSYLLINGLFPLPQNPVIIKEEDIQISGTDIQINTSVRIQVKCDLRAGKNGSGNLFLQIAECNPFRSY